MIQAIKDRSCDRVFPVINNNSGDTDIYQVREKERFSIKNRNSGDRERALPVLRHNS